MNKVAPFDVSNDVGEDRRNNSEKGIENSTRDKVFMFQ